MSHFIRSAALTASLLASTIACSFAAPSPPVPAAPASESARKITFNGQPASARDLEILARYEQAWGAQIPSGDYWYDNMCGAAGQWGGPTRGFLAPGLGLGGPRLPANASGGGKGMTTGVFINGREIHPLDYQGLTGMFGQPPWPGQWWVDGQFNFGSPGQPAIGNLLVLVNQRNQSRGQGSSYYKSDVGTGKSTFVGSGCAAVSARKSPSRSDSDTYSYYVGCD